MIRDNRPLLDELFSRGRIQLQRGRLLDQPIAPLTSASSFERVKGMLLGLAIGDALGNTSESQTPATRTALHSGEIRDYPLHRYAGDTRGYPSDDSQLAFWMLEHLIQHRGLDPQRLAERFAREPIYGIGSTMRGFLRSFKAGTPWYEAGQASAGNGAIMRISPILIPHLYNGGTALWADTAIAAMLTHNHAASTSACLAFVAMLREVMDMAAPPEPRWWRDRYVELAADLEGDTPLSARGGVFADYHGPLWRFVQDKLAWAQHRNLSTRKACEAWHSGAYVLETVPCVLWTLTCHAHAPEEAIVRAVNDTWDNDTTAAIVGAFVGALHGASKLPSRWMTGLSGRTGARDDGRVQELIELARLRFDPKGPRYGDGADLAETPEREAQSGREAFRIVAGAVATLHREGYEWLRLYCYVKEGLGVMRYFVFASPTLASLQELRDSRDLSCISDVGTPGMGANSVTELVAEWKQYEGTLLDTARGHDPAYVTWFSEMMLRSGPQGYFEMEGADCIRLNGRGIPAPQYVASRRD